MRASRAAKVARTLGFERVLVLNGGMGSWRSANLPVEKTT
jgi:rhodanese-related sulfurtransferase